MATNYAIIEGDAVAFDLGTERARGIVSKVNLETIVVTTVTGDIKRHKVKHNVNKLTQPKTR